MAAAGHRGRAGRRGPPLAPVLRLAQVPLRVQRERPLLVRAHQALGRVRVPLTLYLTPLGSSETHEVTLAAACPRAPAGGRACEAAYRTLVESVTGLSDEGLRRSALHAPVSHAELIGACPQ